MTYSSSRDKSSNLALPSSIADKELPAEIPSTQGDTFEQVLIHSDKKEASATEKQIMDPTDGSSYHRTWTWQGCSR